MAFVDNRETVVTTLDDGGFMVERSGLGPDGVFYTSHVSTYDANGVLIDVTAEEDAVLNAVAFQGTVTRLENGTFLDVWIEESEIDGTSNIHAQRYSARGVALGETFQINPAPVDASESYTVSATGDGGFVVLWSEESEDADGSANMVQHFNWIGRASGSATEVPANASVTGLENGNFVVTWINPSRAADEQILYQMFDSDGNAFGPIQRSGVPEAYGDFQDNRLGRYYVEAPLVVAVEGGGFQLFWSHAYHEAYNDYPYAEWDFTYYYNAMVSVDALGYPAGQAVDYSVSQNTSLEVNERSTEVVTYLDDGRVLIESDPTQIGSQAEIIETNFTESDPVQISGSAVEGEQLQAHLVYVDGDASFDVGSVTYQWLRDGEPIEGATERTYTLVQADVDAGGVSVAITYSDPDGNAEAVTGPDVAIENTNDVATGAPQIIGVAAQGYTLRATANGIIDEDGITAGTASYQWFRDGEPIAGGTAPTYILTAEDVGAEISVVASYTDDYGTEESIESLPSARVVTRENLLRGDTANNILQGTGADELLRGELWNDTLYGAGGDDTLQGGDNEDRLEGDGGHDRLEGDAGDDTLFGGWGDDTLWGGSGDDVLDGGAGADVFDGGEGFDMVSYTSATSSVRVDLQNPAYMYGDAVGDSFANVEAFQTGNTVDQLRGDAGANEFHAGGLSDRLYGRAGDDLLFGEGGSDAFYGGMGADTMTGGDDAGRRDRYIYFDIRESGAGEGNRDVITDFVSGEDRIEISRFDANVNAGYKQDFFWIGNNPLPGTEGALGYIHSGGNTIVQADVDGDGLADFEIELTGIMDLTVDDFLL